MRGSGGQASSCLNWWVLRTSPLKLDSQMRDPGRAQYSSGGGPPAGLRLWGKKQAPYSPSRSLFPMRQNFSLNAQKTALLKRTEKIPLKIPYHVFLALIIAIGGTTRIGLHAFMFEIIIIINYSLTVYICKTNFRVTPSRVTQSAVIDRTLCAYVGNSEVVNIAGSREARLLHFGTAQCTD